MKNFKTEFVFLLFFVLTNSEAQVFEEKNRLFDQYLEQLCMFKRRNSTDQFLNCVETYREREETEKVFENYFWKWSETWDIKLENNCYNFATGVMSYSYARPGRGGGKEFEILECKDIKKRRGLISASIADGLRPVKEPACEKKERVLALVTSGRKVSKNNRNFHWYVLTEIGLWAHKYGKERPSLVDDHGFPIRDPRSAKRGLNKYFCGFFCADPAHLKVK